MFGFKQQKLGTLPILIVIGSLCLVTDSIPHDHHRLRYQDLNDTYTRIPHPKTNFTISDVIDIDRVGEGIETIMRGISQLRLSEILRGSFMFTRNEDVKKTAGTVIDSIFGRRNESGIRAENLGIFPLRGL